MNVQLVPLQEKDKESFILNIQIAFKKAVVEQFGPFDGEIIPRDHVIRSFEAEGAENYNIVCDGEVVGETVLAIHPETKRNALQLLYIDVNCHSKGYAYETARAFFDFLFNEKGARRIYAYTEDYNLPSQHLCEKLGMRREGLFMEFVSFVRNPDGTPLYENTMQYAILKKEWK